jgi:hypothetical protein
MLASISPPRTDPAGLEQLAPLWQELHRHHREVSDYTALVEDLAVSWERRLRWYRRLLGEGAAYLTASDDGGRLIGYAVVTRVLRDGRVRGGRARPLPAALRQASER